jgi:2-C-methyl-D-erythritol 4-phosphate cytidylyltransferase
VVCLEGWTDILLAYCKQFGITKLEKVVNGGSTGLQSIRNGLFDLETRYHSEDDIVLIHDAIRPMVSQDIISDNIRVCKQYGNAITMIPCTGVMLKTFDSVSSSEQIPRDNLKITQTPQTFFLKDILAAHREAIKKGINDSIASCSLYVELGKKLYLSLGSEKNIKLTTSEDIEIFMALLETTRPEWLKK